MFIGLIYLVGYIDIFLYLFTIMVLAIFLVLLTRIVSPHNLDHEKLSAYECGFDPFITTRIQFDVSFVAIAILYLIFDLEIILLLPWVIFYYSLGSFAFWIVLIFLGIVMLGFFYEWSRGTLIWT